MNFKIRMEVKKAKQQQKRLHTLYFHSYKIIESVN